MERVDLAAERAGEPDLVDGLDPGVVHQQPDAGVECGLRQLDRPDVVLGDRDPRPAGPEPSWRTYENVRPSATTRGVRAASAPSTIPSGVMTPARNSSAMTSTIPEPQMPVTPVSAVASAKPGSSDQASDADHPEARLQRLAVDPDPLDRARRGALARR